jgi:hypothetical protein
LDGADLAGRRPGPVCAKDNAISPVTQRFMAARASQVVEWDTDHSPFLTRPGDLADLLLSYRQVPYLGVSTSCIYHIYRLPGSEVLGAAT